MPLTVLITGFGPFPGAAFNPTAALAQALARRRRPALGDVIRIAHVVPTSYAAVVRELPDLVARHRPDLVLLFGLAPRTPHLRVETRARNRRSTLFADIEGSHPSSAIRLAGPAALLPQCSQRPLLAAVRATRAPARLSVDAGKYLCNFAYWRALELTRGDGGLVQFVHVPNISRVDARKRRARRKPRRLRQADLLRAGEAVLLALLVAARGTASPRQRVRPALRSSFDPAATRTKKPIAAFG
jgi:pyroglutamyl-peptidase